MQVAMKDQQDTYRSYLPNCLEEKEPLFCTKKSQTIESLLPDEEDLFYGVLDELVSTDTTNDEDLDLFNSIGGMELEEKSEPHFTQQNPSIPTFHHQSVPINHEGFVHNDPLKLPSVGFISQTNMLNPYGLSLSMEQMYIGHHHAYSFSNHFQNHHPNPVIWSHSVPYDNTFNPHTFPNLHGVSEIPPPVFIVSPKPNLILNFPSKVASSHVKGHKSSKRDKESTLPFSSNRSKGRTRRMSHGRHDTVSCNIDDKKYELDIERVLNGEDNRTTLMIKNIPNKYSSKMLLAAIDEHNQGTYDFIYLPLDFKNKCNMGYAFINMIDPLQIVQFHKSFHGKKWEKFHSGKVAYLAYARIQGKAALIAHFQESSLMNEDKCCHPILFTTDGPNAGNQEPFPLGQKFHSRRNKNKCNGGQVFENEEVLSDLCQIKHSV